MTEDYWVLDVESENWIDASNDNVLVLFRDRQKIRNLKGNDFPTPVLDEAINNNTKDS